MSRERLIAWRFVFSVSLLVIIWMATRNPSEIPPILFSIDDFAQHALTFLYLAAVMARAYPPVRHGLIWIFLTFYGILIEAIQSLLPFREASVVDLAANTAGLALFEMVLLTKGILLKRKRH
ncbi:VanZ family protein [Thermodesulforhabdus norvegica]|uniref:VanZ like family protein n=1 Tax=Thermodesulforhabdus norvegica TaxID=39841 RepID=A0A1I4W6R0_9BACT|nr:VanZ family protein [Thermodesulforhabdus norvegica]SFN09077.1 hypothetical protein SAMN05660836_02629 [Thermodesulforhabdus norvegica]